MTGLRRYTALAAAFLCSALCGIAWALTGVAAPLDPLFARSEEVSVSTEATLNAGVADLEVYCSVGGAKLLIDKSLVGAIPYAGSLWAKAAPGAHYLEVSLEGYYDAGIWLILEEKTKYTLSYRPRRITGFLSIESQPVDAAISIDGAPLARGLVELPIGTHLLTARRFGYVEQRASVEIRERTTSSVSIILEKAPFEISGLAFGRAVFNPRNAGAPGRTSLDFRASSYGSAIAEIRGPDGALAATLEYPSIDSWDQSRSWDGLGPDGKALPDGIYTATLEAKPAPGEPEGTIRATAEARIDSSFVVRTIGAASGTPGLLYMPDPLTQPAGTQAAEASWFLPWGKPQASAFGLSAAISLGGLVTLAAAAVAETGDAGGGAQAAADIAGSALVTVFGDRARPLSGALFAKGSYSSASSPALPGARSSIELSFPLSARLGELSLALAPGALVDWAGSGPSVLGLAKAGLWLEGRAFRAGASGELPISFSGGGPAPSWPARAALEGRLSLGSTPLVAAAYLGADLEPGAALRLAIGLGLGLLF